MLSLDSTYIQTVGTIPKDIYALLPFDRTDVVVLTSERLRKNRKHHPEMDQFYNLLVELVEDPDLVCKNKSCNRTIIFYRRLDNDHYLRIAVLMTTDEDPPDYKNSIQSYRIARKRECQKDLIALRHIWIEQGHTL